MDFFSSRWRSSALAVRLGIVVQSGGRVWCWSMLPRGIICEVFFRVAVLRRMQERRNEQKRKRDFCERSTNVVVWGALVLGRKRTRGIVFRGKRLRIRVFS